VGCAAFPTVLLRLKVGLQKSRQASKLVEFLISSILKCSHFQKDSYKRNKEDQIFKNKLDEENIKIYITLESPYFKDFWSFSGQSHSVSGHYFHIAIGSF